MENPIDFKTANSIQFSFSQGKSLNEVLTNPEKLSVEMGTSLGLKEIEELKLFNKKPMY